MSKVSALLIVYNEEKLLPAVLANIEPYVDEIIVVDGSSEGPSTDSTAEVVKSSGDKVIYKSGTFRQPNGAWDRSAQYNAAITVAIGDIFMFLSADMLFSNMEQLREVIESKNSFKLFFTSTIEFWQDTNHMRLYSVQGDLLTIPSSIMQVVAVDRSLKPIFQQDGSLKVEEARLFERVLVPQTTKYHLGWIRPFNQQVAKHIRHVTEGRWGEHGEKLLKGAKVELDLWAIVHVLGYKIGRAHV